MKTIDILVTVTYDDKVLRAEPGTLSVMRNIEDSVWLWGAGYVTYTHARELKGIRE